MVIRKKNIKQLTIFRGVHWRSCKLPFVAADALITAISPQHREAQRPAFMASGFRGQNPSVEDTLGGSPVQSC